MQHLPETLIVITLLIIAFGFRRAFQHRDKS